MSGRVTRRFTLVLAVVTLLALLVAQVGQATSTTVLKEVRAKNGMVAAASPIAAQVGVDILKAGGNAVDAAVAAAFAIGVVEPNATGIGGEGMMVIYLANEKKAVAIDYRSTAPKLAAEKFANSKMPSKGWESVATPGVVAGLCEALQKYGTMTLEQVLAPSIKLAEEGFPLSPTVAQVIEDNYETILSDPGLAKVFLDNGLPPAPGFIVKNPELAETLRKIAKGGPDVFYRGEIADAIDKAMRENGGLLTKEDLAAYKPIIRWPARGNYRGYELISAPPPVGGATVIEAMNILENFDLGSMPYTSVQSIHVISEALKRAFTDNRAYVGDPDFSFVPLQEMLSEEYAKLRAAEIRMDRMTPAKEILPGKFEKPAAALAPTGTEGKYESPSTTHISVADKYGNMVALTQTLSSFFGAGVMVPGTGIILNNEIYNFSTDAASPNRIAPGKRMRTTISPTIVLKDGKPFLTIGTPGAGRIISTMTTLLVNIIDHNMGLQEAIEAPRFYVRDGSDNFECESRMPAELLEGLKSLGYPIKESSVKGDYDLYFGGAQGVMIDYATGEFVGAADPRRDGAAIGY